jgi:hypothetical protein
MRKAHFPILALAVAVLSVLVWSFALASDGPDKTKPGEKQSLYKAAGTPRYGLININNLTTWHRSDGQSNHSPGADNGMYFPKGTGNVIYQDGVVFGGRVYVGGFPGQGGTPASLQPIRVGGGTYGVGTKEGWVTGLGATATAVNPNDPRARIYRIRRDYASMSPIEARQDAAFYNETTPAEVSDAAIAAMIAQYDKDWKEWPVDLGAPYIDRNGNGRYDPPPAFSSTFTVDSLIAQNRDEPGVAGADPNSPADQVLWTVYNDLDRSQALGFVGSEPIGLEIQKTVWAYKRSDALGNLYFSRYKLINKGGVDIGGGQKGAFYIDEMYVCQWSDPDLGSFSDDLAGCDSTLSIGFIYNGNANDDTFRKFGLAPPSAAYDFLAGPIVPDPNGTAVFDLKYRQGFRNLGMSSFAYFSAGSPYSDPPGGSGAYSTGTGRWYKMLRGFAPLGTITDPDQPYNHPPGAPITKFPLSGDPVARTGFLDGLGTLYSFAPGDRRILLNTGPFRMAPGDTQEIYIGTVAGIGADRLSSVAVMKFNDRFVQNTFDALFQVPKPPLPPDVKVAELDGQVVLEWGSNVQRVRDVEERIAQPGAYRFEGYNVYQLPSRGSRLSEAKRIVTYDTPDDPTVVLDEQFDEKSGQILRIPVQFGSNSGIKRFFNFNRDYIRDIDKIYNGQEYYLAVTAYSVATVPGFLPTTLESDAIILTVRPKVPFGKIYGARFGDTLKVTKTGKSDGVVRPIVIDPTRLTGNTYQVRFADAGGGSTTWSLVNTTLNRTLLSGETNQSGDDLYKIVDGIFLKVEGPPPGMKDWAVPKGTRRVTFADANGFGFEGFEGAIGWDDPAHFFGNTSNRAVPASQLKDVILRWGQASASSQTNGLSPYGGWDRDASTDPNFSYGYRYVRNGQLAPARPEFAQYLVNPAGGTYGYNDYKISVPLSAWDAEANPPARLAVGFLENNVAAGLVDGRYYPPSNGVQDNTASSGPREWLFIFNKPYTGATPDPSLQVNILTNGLPVMWWCTFNRRGNNLWDEPTGTNEFLIMANHVNTPSTVFTFTAPATQSGLEIEKASAEKVGVFPNPYYAFNAAETNRFFRFVTFNNLPRKATFRIFNLAGQLVRTLQKDDDSQFFRWDLTNHAQFPVASGIYIVHIDMPDIGVTKVLKLAIIQEQEVLDTY